MSSPFDIGPVICGFLIMFLHWWSHVQGMMRSDMIVLSEPNVDRGLGCLTVWNTLRFRISLRRVPLSARYIRSPTVTPDRSELVDTRFISAILEVLQQRNSFAISEPDIFWLSVLERSG
jgi:hypothetical protein